MLAEFPVPQPEHVDHVIVDFVSGWRKFQEAPSRMDARICALYENKIPFGLHHVDRGFCIGNGCKKKQHMEDPLCIGTTVLSLDQDHSIPQETALEHNSHASGLK